MARWPRWARPTRIARRTASFLAESLLHTLGRRSDLDPETCAILATEIRRRIAADPGGPASDGLDSAEDRARVLLQAGRLDEPALARALEEGDRAFVKAALAARSGVKSEIVDKILGARSAKGVTALAGKAGLPVGFAVTLQLRLASIPPHNALMALPQDRYPLGREEMNWHLEFFGG
ncbi:MAG: DUF2336 domain-containing protein [Pseudomonadota bacterium]